MNTKEEILCHTTQILAREGSAGTSMRKVASAVGIEPSVIYNYFEDKETLLRSTRMYITGSLDTAMRALPPSHSIHEQLLSNITFQFENRVLIVALLQYFMAVKTDFPKTADGYVPQRAYQHMTELIRKGVEEGVYTSKNIDFDSKIITHLINGFLMEYFGHEINKKEMDRLVIGLTNFIERSLGVK